MRQPSSTLLVDILNIHLHSSPSIRVYYELAMWPAPSWLDSSAGRALHRYRRGHGFESRSGPNFFPQALILQLLSFMYNCNDQSRLHIFLRISNIWYFIYSIGFFAIYECIRNSQLQCEQLPVDLIVLFVEHCPGISDRGHGLESLLSQVWIFFFFFFRL